MKRVLTGFHDSFERLATPGLEEQLLLSIRAANGAPGGIRTRITGF